MLTRWFEIDPTHAALEELRQLRDIASFFNNWDTGLEATWPRANLYDTGEELVLRAEVPGLDEKDLKIEAYQEVLTISGERKVQVPEGWSTHRRERENIKFSRSFSFPVHVDVERVSADVKNGQITVHLPKAAAVLPKAISVQAR